MHTRLYIWTGILDHIICLFNGLCNHMAFVLFTKQFYTLSVITCVRQLLQPFCDVRSHFFHLVGRMEENKSSQRFR